MHWNSNGNWRSWNGAREVGGYLSNLRPHCRFFATSTVGQKSQRRRRQSQPCVWRQVTVCRLLPLPLCFTMVSTHGNEERWPVQQQAGRGWYIQRLVVRRVLERVFVCLEGGVFVAIVVVIINGIFKNIAQLTPSIKVSKGGNST